MGLLVAAIVTVVGPGWLAALRCVPLQSGASPTAEAGPRGSDSVTRDGSEGAEFAVVDYTEAPEQGDRCEAGAPCAVRGAGGCGADGVG
ncbi:hypothetical protein GCM10009540_20680 [Streptomyces turgidiscabies]